MKIWNRTMKNNAIDNGQRRIHDECWCMSGKEEVIFMVIRFVCKCQKTILIWPTLANCKSALIRSGYLNVSKVFLQS